MDRNDIMETNDAPLPGDTEPFPPPADEKPPVPVLTWQDGAVPALALVLAWLFWACFDPVRMGDFGFPHLGVLALVCAHFGAVFIILGRRARINVGSLFLTAAALALGLSCALYASDVFLVLNCFVILATAAMGTFALSGHLDPGRIRALFDGVGLTVLALCTKLDRPFRTLGRAFRGDKRRLGTALLAAFIALPVLAVVLWLLASADAVFSSLFARFDLSDLPAGLFMRAVRVLVLALFLASALYFIREAPVKEAPSPARERRAALFLPVVILLDVVYIIFCAVQVRYLFGGAEAAAMAGGWAQYARSGFFQLVAVAFIDLTLCLIIADESRLASRGGRLLRWTSLLLLALTGLILFSAFWRMRLYILVYGLSILRLETLWAMAAIAAGVLAVGWKLLRPGFNAWRWAGGFALGLWCMLCLAGPCGLIARYNVDQYLSGALEQMDGYYLRTLSADALPALRKLDVAGQPGCGDFILQLERENAGPVPWTQASLSGYRAGRSARQSQP